MLKDKAHYLTYLTKVKEKGVENAKELSPIGFIEFLREIKF